MTTSEALGDRVLTIPEAAEILRITPATARVWAKKGQMPGILPKLGGQWRVSENALRAYMAAGMTAADRQAEAQAS